MNRIAGILLLGLLMALPLCAIIYFFTRPRPVHCNGPQPANSICTPVNEIALFQDYGGWKCTQTKRYNDSDFAGEYLCYSEDGHSVVTRGGSMLPSTVALGDTWLKTRNNAGLYAGGEQPNTWYAVSPK